VNGDDDQAAADCGAVQAVLKATEHRPHRPNIRAEAAREILDGATTSPSADRARRARQVRQRRTAQG